MALWHRTRVNPLPGMNKDRTLYQLANAYCRRWLEKAGGRKEARGECKHQPEVPRWWSVAMEEQSRRLRSWR